MAEQRERARAAAKSSRAGDEAAYRALLESEGATPFVGRESFHVEVPARVVAVLEGGAGDDPTVEIVLDRTPFYAESGGQVGDTGTIVTESGIADVLDTQFAVPGLVVHRARVERRHRGGTGRAGHDRRGAPRGHRAQPHGDPPAARCAA